MDKKIKGRVWKYGDDVNTDVIFPGKYTYTVNDPAEMGEHAMEDIDPEFAGKVQKNDVIIAGKNFGCGSSREQAAVCLKVCGPGLASVIPALLHKTFNCHLNTISCHWLSIPSNPQAIMAILSCQKILLFEMAVGLGWSLNGDRSYFML